MWKVKRTCVPIFLIHSLVRSFFQHIYKHGSMLNSIERDKTNEKAKKKESFRRLFAICWLVLAALLYYWSIDKRRFMTVIFVQFILEPYFYLLILILYFLFVCVLYRSYEPSFSMAVFAVVTLIHRHISSVCVFVCVSILVCIGREKSTTLPKNPFFLSDIFTWIWNFVPFI